MSTVMTSSALSREQIARALDLIERRYSREGEPVLIEVWSQQAGAHVVLRNAEERARYLDQFQSRPLMHGALECSEREPLPPPALSSTDIGGSMHLTSKPDLDHSAPDRPALIITPEMVSAGRVVLDLQMSFWECAENDYRRDEMVSSIFSAMHRASKQKKCR